MSTDMTAITSSRTAGRTERRVEPGVGGLPDPPLAGGRVPLLGHAAKLLHDPLGFLAQLRDHGDLVRLKVGPKTLYAVTAPNLVGALVTNPAYGIGGPLWNTLEALLGNGVATTSGARHQRQRLVIQPSLRKETIAEYETVMVEEAYALAERWRPGATVDITREAFRTAVRVTARCLLRVEHINELAERMSTALATVFAGMYRRMILSYGILSYGPFYRLPLPAHRRFDRALAELHRLADEVIAERRTARHRPDDLLTALLDATDFHGRRVGHQEVHDQVIAILTPGSETMASQLMWILHLLADHPDQAARIAAEVNAVANGRPVTFGDLGRLTHTTHVIVEAMRLRPAVWIFTRRTNADTELGGYRIPAGNDIIYSPMALQRDPRSFARHLNFDPDRWRPERAADVPKHAMSPFSAGNRKCPGDHFAMTQLTFILAALVPRWRFKHVPEADLSPRIGITLRPQRLMLRVVPR